MMVDVRSERFFSPKKAMGSFRNFSARDTLLTALSSYTDV